jgi:hypothetical protein
MKTFSTPLTLCLACVALACLGTGCSTVVNPADVNWQSNPLDAGFKDDTVQGFQPYTDLQMSPDTAGLGAWTKSRAGCYTLSLIRRDIAAIPASWKTQVQTGQGQ